MYPMYPNNYFHPNWFSGCNSGCCNHTYPAIQPPHSCIPPPPSPFYYHHGPYPPYPAVYPPYYAGAYPPPYHAPPNFSVDQPRYEFDKGVQGRHCGGCRNDGAEVKKEENKVDVAKETDSLVAPPKSKDENPFPLLWGFPAQCLQQKDGAQGGKGCHSLEKNRDEEGNRNQGKDLPFPFPMFWFPEYQRGKDAEISEEQPTKFKVIPVNPLPREEDRRQIPEVANNKDKNTNEKGEKEFNGTGENSKQIHVKNNEKKIANKSPPKGSKLPPVCLRVDPLPKRKSCKGTPSPPSEIKPVESKADTSPAEESKADQVKLNHNKKEVVTPPSPQPPSPHDDATGKNTTTAEERSKKKELSRTEAALVIQSFYRGFDVRKWQPLKKLKQIAKVQEQVNEVRQRILDLEASLNSPKDEKQKVLIAETIMSLLLQLDTIQGLHPSVREIRKGVAKELVSLQERLDLIVSSSNGVEGKIDNKQNESEQQVRNDEEFTEIESNINSPPEEEAKHPSEAVKDPMESPTRLATELEKAECGGEGKEQPLVEMPESIESGNGSLLEPAKLVEEAGHPEPLQLEAVHLPMESSIENDSGMEHTAETEKLECQLQEQEQFSAEAAVSSAETGEVESSLFEPENESGVYAVDNHGNGNVSQTAENRLGELESINYVPVEDKPSVEVLESVGDKSSVEGFERAQDSTEVPACELEESSEAIVMVDMEVNSEMQGDTEEALNKDEPATREGGSELPVFVTDDMPLLHTDEDEAVGPVFVQDGQGVEEQKDVAECSTLPVYGLEVEPSAEGIACAIDDFEESALKETGDDDEPVYSNEHQPACPVAMEGAENIYENDVHCCDETDTSSKVNDVVESVNADIKDPPTGNPQETEDVKGDKGGVPMKLMEENVQLKDLLGMLIKEGKEQMILISDLNGRIKTLEKNLAKKKKNKLRMPRHKRTRHLLV